MLRSAVVQKECPLCGAGGEELYGGLRDRSYDAPGRWALRSCPDCALVWLDPRPEPEKLAALYTEYFTHDAPAPESPLLRVVHLGIPTTRGFDGRRVGARERRWGRALARVGPLRELGEQSVAWLDPRKDGRFLDVGCGSGALLERMHDFGWEVRGIEADPVAAEVARARLGTAAIHAGPLETAPFDNGGFDAVTLFHVIEHVTDPRGALARCERLLAPGGRLVVATPNLRSLGRRKFGRNWLHWDPPRHLQIFCAENLEALIRETGLRVDRVFTPSCSSAPVWRASSLIRDRGGLPGVDTRGASLGHKLASLVFWAWEYRRTRTALCGEDLVVLAGKPEAAS